MNLLHTSNYYHNIKHVSKNKKNKLQTFNFQKMNSASVSQILEKPTYLLPFTIRVKVLQTVRQAIPTLTYQYIHPEKRTTTSLNFLNRLKGNSSHNLNPLTTLKLILKI